MQLALTPEEAAFRDELRNIYNDPAHQKLVADLKTELARLRKELEDDDRFANQQPPGGVDSQRFEGPHPTALGR